MYRNLQNSEIAALSAQGCTAEDWSRITVAEGFHTDWIRNVVFSGEVKLGSNGAEIACGAGVIRRSGVYNAALHNCTVGDGVLIYNVGRYIANYDIAEGVMIENVGQISCEGSGSFGNGVEVSAINEAGGREVPIYDELTAQVAYVMAMYRHRTETVAWLRNMVARKVREKTSSRGYIGKSASVVNTVSLVDVRIGAYATVDGASTLSNGTVNSSAESPSCIGSGVAARDFIIARSARVDTGAMLRSCFVGEGVVIENGFSAEHSLFFANSHCTHGEACAVFAGPYTVSHHRATLLIAGYFSFFNAGSGANQSNHMYKSGPVHQGIHLRGCKFSSDAYILLPASTGVFTIVKGRHYQHHDTDYMPFSYLIEERGDSYLLPAMNLRSYGTARDIRKWPGRDRRRGVASDLIRYELMTPYTAGKIIRAIHECEFLLARYPTAEEVTWNRVKIKTPALRKGLLLYTQALRGYLSELLEHGTVPGPGLAALPDDAPAGLATPPDGVIEWIDLAGLIVPSAAIDRLLDEVDAGRLAGFEILEQHLRKLDTEYSGMVASWAVYALEKLLKKSAVRITAGDLRQVIAQGEADRAALAAGVEMDARRDFAPLMAVGYGIDSEQYRDADFRAIDTGQRTFNRLFDGERISGWRVRNGAFAESYLPWIGFCRKFRYLCDARRFARKNPDSELI